MKKRLFSRLSVLAVLIVFVSSCSKKAAEYTYAIPADATEVAIINLKSLAEKAGINDQENKESLKKLTDAMKSGMNAATFQQMEAIMNDPSKSGVDVKAPIYLFSAPTFKHATVVAKVSNEEDLKKFLEVAQKEMENSAITEADGYSFVKVQDQALLAFNTSTLLAVNLERKSDFEKVQEGVSALFKQTRETSINNNGSFKKLQEQDGDIRMFVSPASLLGSYAKKMQFGLPKDLDLKDLMILGSLSFDEGQIDLQLESYTENEKLKAIFEKQTKATCPIENTFLPYFPKSTVALFSMGVNGEAIYNYLLENEDVQKVESVLKTPEVKEMFEAFQNDLTIGIVNVTMNNAPSFLAYASLKNTPPLQMIYEKKGELGLKRGEDIVKLNENEYVYKARNINIFFGVRNKQMYATNDELLYKNIGKAVDPSAKEANYAAALKGNRSGGVINTEAILGLPVVKMLVGYGGEEYKTYYSLANNITYLDVLSNTNTSSITLHLKDKEVNSLKQIVNFVKEFTGI